MNRKFLLALVAFIGMACSWVRAEQQFPSQIFSGLQGNFHVQGIAYDARNECVYMSFTTSLVKVDLQGNLLGSVTGITGHLGGISLNPDDGKLYGSLEYKHDAIGQGIMNGTGARNDAATGFYIAIMDGQMITRPGMDAREVMKTVYLPEVVDDMLAKVQNGGRERDHRLGCSGIDGVTFAPRIGQKGGRMYLYVAYGVYADADRTDNDQQVLLCYDVTGWKRYARELDASRIHRSGPAKCQKRYYVRTGNTSWGIQNLCYDAHSGHIFAAVYPGVKKDWTNYSLYVIDTQTPARRAVLQGVEPRTEGEMLSLVPAGLHDRARDVWGWNFPYGSTGMTALGDGLFYISHNGKDRSTGREYTNLNLYRWTDEEGFCLDFGFSPDFNKFFQDKTLRLDYTFSGNNREQKIYLDELQCADGWFGRHVNLDSLLLLGNGQITITDTLGQRVLYRHSFSTLFQEWQSTEEATRVNKSFENVFLVPMPRQPVDVTVTLTDTHNQVTSRLKHRVDPQDILIRPLVAPQGAWKYLRQAGDSREKIDLAFVPEGYSASEMELFEKDCQEAMEAILTHEPFQSMKDRFNFVAVMKPSQESGVSIPHNDLWKNTLVGSNYDTFYSERYLTTLHMKRLHDALAGVPYEHILILANTENYGGGGIYNSYLMSSAHHPTKRPVLVHEFGHSYAGLADEYFYDDQYETMYPSDTEPWEPNITTLVNFKSKWQDMLPEGTPIPTTPDGKDVYTKLGVYEGAGYQSKGAFRPVQECRMKINAAPTFCPVCDRAIRRITDYYTR